MMKKLALALLCSLALQGAAVAEEYVHRYESDYNCFVIVTNVYTYSKETITTKYTCDEWDQKQSFKAFQKEFEAKQKLRDEKKVKLDALLKKYPIEDDIEQVNEFYNGKNKFFPDKVAKSLSNITSAVESTGELRRVLRAFVEVADYSSRDWKSRFEPIICMRDALKRIYNNGYKFVDNWKYKKIKTKCKLDVWAFYTTVIDEHGNQIHYGFYLRADAPPNYDDDRNSFAPINEIESGISGICK